MAVTLATTPRDRLSLGYNGTGYGVCGYNGQPYDAINNPGGMDGNGVSVNWINMCADMVSCGLMTADDAATAAAAASQQEAWGPSFTTAAGTVTFLTATTFTAAGDAAATFPVGSHVAADCGVDGYRYGLVSGVSGTTVSVSLFSGALTANLRRVYNVETKMIYLFDYLDISAAVTSARASQDAALFSQNSAALSASAALSSQNEAALSAFKSIRDTLGAFSGVIRPTLNLHAGLVSNDDCPLGTFSRSSTKWRLGPTGLLESVAADKVAREWDTGGNLLGWLIEEQRTNLFTYSEQFDNAAWLKGQATISPNSAYAPDGSLSADKLVEDSSLNQHYISQNLGVRTIGDKIALTIFAEAAERKQLAITSYGEGTSVFDLLTGTIVQTGGNVCSIIPVGNGRYRCSVVITKTNTNGNCFFLLWNNGNNYQGNGSSGLYMWGAQAEVGSFHTSYITTTTVAVTRPADVWTIPTSAFPYNTSEGSIYIDCDLSVLSPATQQRIYTLDDGVGPNYKCAFALVGNLSPFYSVTAGSPDSNIGIVAIPSPGTRMRIASAFKLNDAAVSYNGSTVSTDAVVGMPAFTTLRIGTYSGGNLQIDGHIKHFAYFPRRLSDSNIQLMTA